MTRKELKQAGKTWKQVHLSTVIFKRNTVEALDIPEYDLKGWRKIHAIREVVILLFGTTVVKGITNLKTQSKYFNVVVESVLGYLECIATARSYGVLKSGRGKIDICLRNDSAKQITLQKWTTVGEIAAANIIPALLALKPTGHVTGKGEATTIKKKCESQTELLDKIDLTGLGKWVRMNKERPRSS